MPSIPPKLTFPLKQFQDGGYFLETNRNIEISRTIWQDDLFFLDQPRTRTKVDQPQNFCLPKTNFVSL